MTEHTQKIKLLEVKHGHSFSEERDGVGKAGENKLSGLGRPAPPHGPGFLLNPLRAGPRRCVTLCWNNLLTHPRNFVFYLREAQGWTWAVSSDSNMEAKGTLWNAFAFPTMTRRLLKLLISETSLGTGGSRNVLKRQQSLLRPGAAMVSGVDMVPPSCSLLACPAPQLSPRSFGDEGVCARCSVWVSLVCLLAAVWVRCGRATPTDSYLFPWCHIKWVSIHWLPWWPFIWDRKEG